MNAVLHPPDIATEDTVQPVTFPQLESARAKTAAPVEGTGEEEAERLLQSDLFPPHSLPLSLRKEYDRERSRLRQALEQLRRTRENLHKQAQLHEERQQHVLETLRKAWQSRRQHLEKELAVAALRKARQELAAEKIRLQNDMQKQMAEWIAHRRKQEEEWSARFEAEKQQLQKEREQLAAEKERMQRLLAEERRLLNQQREELQHLQQQIAASQERLQQQSARMQQDMNALRQKLVKTELELVQTQSQWMAEKRRWAEERAAAEAVIRDLLAELDSSPQDGFRNRAA